VAHAAPKKGGKMRAVKATFAALCFGIGVAFVTGAIYGLVRPSYYRDSTEVWMAVMIGVMFLLGGLLLLWRKADR
jgi:multisubunit Na+/H+ antiporter MnhG subunit